MQRHEIELVSTATNDVKIDLIHSSDISSVAIYKPGKPWSRSLFGKSQSSCSDNYLLLSMRIDHCKEGYEDIDDPIARPVTALSRAHLGAHTQGLSPADVAKVCRGYMTEGEYQIVVDFAAKLVEGISPDSKGSVPAESSDVIGAMQLRPRI